MERRPADILAIIGPCATGKTVLAEKLAQTLGWPLLAKDALKETLFEHLGGGDLKWSQRLGMASFELIWVLAGQLARANVAHIIEYPSTGPDYLSTGLQRLRERYGAQIHIVELTASPDTIVARAKARIDAGNRHPAHHDESIMAELARPVPPFGHLIPADRRILINTDDVAAIDAARLAAWARQRAAE